MALMLSLVACSRFWRLRELLSLPPKDCRGPHPPCAPSSPPGVVDTPPSPPGAPWRRSPRGPPLFTMPEICDLIVANRFELFFLSWWKRPLAPPPSLVPESFPTTWWRIKNICRWSEFHFQHVRKCNNKMKWRKEFSRFVKDLMGFSEGSLLVFLILAKVWPLASNALVTRAPTWSPHHTLKPCSLSCGLPNTFYVAHQGLPIYHVTASVHYLYMSRVGTSDWEGKWATSIIHNPPIPQQATPGCSHQFTSFFSLTGLQPFSRLGGFCKGGRMSQMLWAGPPAPPAVGVVRVEWRYNHFQTGSRPLRPTLPLVSHPHLYSSSSQWLSTINW